MGTGAVGSFEWLDQSENSYTNWADGEPNDLGGGEDCTEMLNNGRWNDKNCTIGRPYACKKQTRMTFCEEAKTSTLKPCGIDGMVNTEQECVEARVPYCGMHGLISPPFLPIRHFLRIFWVRKLE